MRTFVKHNYTGQAWTLAFISMRLRWLQLVQRDSSVDA